MLLQMRDTDPAVIARLENVLDALVAEATRTGPCAATWTRLREGRRPPMDATIQNAVAAAAEEIAPGAHLRMPSGAGHDAQFLAQVMPAGMLFVPSIGGISHHWTETPRTRTSSPARTSSSHRARASSTAPERIAMPRTVEHLAIVAAVSPVRAHFFKP